MRCRFDPWIGKIPWKRKWQPTPVFLPGKSHGQRSLMGYSPWGRRVGDDWSDLAHTCTLIKRLNRGIMKSGLRRKKTEEDVQRVPPREMERCLWKRRKSKEAKAWVFMSSVIPGCTPCVRHLQEAHSLTYVTMVVVKETHKGENDQS